MSKIKVIAEVGWNHMGDMDLAEKMIVAASRSGVDIVKFQTWSEKTLKPGPWDNDGRREIYRKAELSVDQHIFLKEVCDRNNVQFCTSLFSLKDLHMVEKLGIHYMKVPSHEVYNLELVTKLADLFPVLLVSTGASFWHEIERLNSSLKNVKSDIVFMHCVSSYPCHAENVNLGRLRALEKFNRTLGYSGHYPGIEDAIYAMAMGAKYIEKHFTIDQDLPGRDNKFALLPAQFQLLIEQKKLMEKMFLDKGKDYQDIEADTVNHYRGRWAG